MGLVFDAVILNPRLAHYRRAGHKAGSALRLFCLSNDLQVFPLDYFARSKIARELDGAKIDGPKAYHQSDLG